MLYFPNNQFNRSQLLRVDHKYNSYFKTQNISLIFQKSNYSLDLWFSSRLLQTLLPSLKTG